MQDSIYCAQKVFIVASTTKMTKYSRHIKIFRRCKFGIMFEAMK